jgi:hypothetical protein
MYKIAAEPRSGSGFSSGEADRERERQLSQLHRNVSGLKSSLELVQSVAANKVKNYLSDNEQLLQEVNTMRYEVRRTQRDRARPDDTR